jgi:hypothetical protein
LGLILYIHIKTHKLISKNKKQRGIQHPPQKNKRELATKNVEQGVHGRDQETTMIGSFIAD